MLPFSVLATVAVIAISSEVEHFEDDALSLLQLRATGGSHWDPTIAMESNVGLPGWMNPNLNAYFPYGPPAPDGKADLEQTETQAKRAKCEFPPGEPQMILGSLAYSEAQLKKINPIPTSLGLLSYQSNIFLNCPNTIDNEVLLGRAQYKTMYPNWECGHAALVNEYDVAIGQHQTMTVRKYIGRTLDKAPELWADPQPWRVHADQCIAKCKAQEPDANAVSVDFTSGSTGHNPVGTNAGYKASLETMITATQYATNGPGCFCNFNATHRWIGSEKAGGACHVRTVWLGDPLSDSDGCPCTNGLSLVVKTPLYSNLGGSGPDMGSPSEIMYPEAGVIGGNVVNVRVWTDDEYKGDGTKNGVKGSLGRLSMKTGKENIFKLAVIDAKSGEVVKLGHKLPLTFLDLDEGKKGKGRATVSVCGAQQFLTQSSELTVSSADGCQSASSSTRGNSKDNPSSVETGLSDAVASKRVVSYILEATDSGIYTFTLKLAKGWGNRNFLFSLSPGAACADDTNMPTG